MRVLATIAVLGLLVTPVLADWNPGDPHKMHFPQLPDPTGWDVEIFTIPIADDWECSETGAVTDIHFWTSWAQDDIGQIGWLDVTIWDNDTSGPYSKPGDPLWSDTFYADDFSVISPYGTGDQGFYDPPPAPDFAEHDHFQYQQINIEDIQDPFIQTVGEIYWLSISADWTGIQSPVGWKTSQDFFMDVPVYWYYPDSTWQLLLDPITQEPLSLAFVITPEPGSFGLMALAALALLRRR
jgi:hypothetical protein